ncbi:hypothetical protein [Glycomyces paridis]|uniref:DUF3558 domain-containing protein n=1 Tax=Glycomyces paridis TaxID=2126555 RepID=A0A4S8P3B5_9ACTN|nr:hypothetical protein [Glycomyces paridis]THV24523.1 hypothetical protein E9998_21155 [Glycomyces paridis]
MKRLLAALAVCAAAFAATACSSEEPAEKEQDGTAAAVEETTEAETEEEAPAAEPAGDCGDERVTAAMADVVAGAGVEFSVDDSLDGALTCTWDTGSDLGAVVTATVSPSTGNAGMSEEVLESLSQEVLDDARFEGVDAIPTVVLGCEEGNASSLLGCAIAVYGQEADITVQALVAPDVTQDQLVDAAWALTEAFAG